MSKLLQLVILSVFLLFCFLDVLFGLHLFCLKPAQSFVCIRHELLLRGFEVVCTIEFGGGDVSEPASEYVISIKAFNTLGNGPSRYETVVTSEDIGMNILLCLCVSPPPAPTSLRLPSNLSLCLSQVVGTNMLLSLSPLLSLPLSLFV